MREIEREGGSPAYLQILAQRLNGADLHRMRIEQEVEDNRRRREHAPRDD